MNNRYYVNRDKSLMHIIRQHVWGKPDVTIAVFFTAGTASRVAAALNAAYEDGVCGDHTHWAPERRPKGRVRDTGG